MTKLLLDVDGVLNAVTHRPPGKQLVPPDTWPESSWRSKRTNGFRITWSVSVVDYLKELANHVDILWLTTWEDQANKYISPLLGLPAFPLAGHRDWDSFDPGLAEGHWWKLAIAQQVWEKEQEPFIWLDDDLAYIEEAREWLATLPQGSHLAIAPNSTKALTQEHLEMIENFVTERVA